MTENESLRELKLQSQVLKSRIQCNREIEEFVSTAVLEYRKDAVDMAIQALEELQHYRAIGTVARFEQLSKQFAPHNTDETSCGLRNCNKCDMYRKENEKYHAIGTIEEFNALKDAEERGSLLPYKIGDKFYEPIEWKNCVEECKISSFTIKKDGDLKIRLSGTYGVFEITTEEIGKTVFFTKEEAEKELAKMKSK